MVIFDRKVYQSREKLFSDIAACIDNNYADAHTDSGFMWLGRMGMLPQNVPTVSYAVPLAPKVEDAKILDNARLESDDSISGIMLRK